MKPIDFRNETFEQVRARMQSDELMVYRAFQQHGPSTTRFVSDCSGIPLLTLRPRTTDLFQLGALRLVGKAGHEGIYQAVPLEAHAQWFEACRQAAVEKQRMLL